jgi:hypothetical protein
LRHICKHTFHNEQSQIVDKFLQKLKVGSFFFQTEIEKTIAKLVTKTMSTHISDTSVLGNFGRHTPKVLRRQLIFQLAEQYLGENQNNQERPNKHKLETNVGRQFSDSMELYCSWTSLALQLYR